MENSSELSPAIVLIVEDEPFIRMLAADTLSAAGYDVIEAVDAAHALRTLGAAGGGGVNLLFTDINMPGAMDGLALARLTRCRWPGIEILITSGRQSLSSSQMPLDAQFLNKPYDMDAMAKRVGEMIANAPSSAPEPLPQAS